MLSAIIVNYTTTSTATSTAASDPLNKLIPLPNKSKMVCSNHQNGRCDEGGKCNFIHRNQDIPEKMSNNN